MPPSPINPSRAKQPGRILSLLAAAALLAGCSLFEATPQPRGNRVDADLLQELVPGTSSRADATALLGSPTAKASFDDNIWIYIGGVTRTRILRTQSVMSQDVVVLSFTDQGVLRDIKRLNKDDALAVSISERTTPTPGSDASFMQQLFGNVGRFVGSGGNNSSAAGGGGAPNRGG